MYDIITFGSATWDVFMVPEKIKTIKSKKLITGEGICFNLGSKIDIEQLKFFSGGGGTNTAVGFAKQGFKTAYCGMVGDDLAGKKIIEDLKQNNIKTNFVFKTNIKPSNYSVIIQAGEKDRTIFAYRGASELLRKRDIPFSQLRAQWFYLAPLSGMLKDITFDIVKFAKKKKIKVAFNPGDSQLLMPEIKKIIEMVDILLLNWEEASLLAGIDYKKEKEIFKKIDKLCPGIVVMTKGPKGAVISDGRYIYRAKSLKVKVADRTGAGDAFGSAFTSGIIRHQKIEKAIQLAIANSSYCLTGWGAKANLLKRGEKFEEIKVKKEACSQNGLCRIKV